MNGIFKTGLRTTLNSEFVRKNTLAYKKLPVFRHLMKHLIDLPRLFRVGGKSRLAIWQRKPGFFEPRLYMFVHVDDTHTETGKTLIHKRRNDLLGFVNTFRRRDDGVYSDDNLLFGKAAFHQCHDGIELVVGVRNIGFKYGMTIASDCCMDNEPIFVCQYGVIERRRDTFRNNDCAIYSA